MTVNEYVIGQDIELRATFTDATDEVDPAAVLIVVRKPDGGHVGYKTAAGWSDQGDWDADDNDPALVNGTGTAGHYYDVSVAGEVDFGDGGITFAVGDQVYYNGDIWQRIPSPSSIAVDKLSTGVYRVIQHATQAGEWFYNTEGVGLYQGATEHRFLVALRSTR